MNRDEAKHILLLYRPKTDDAHDPQIAEALALAKTDAELAQWLETHFARQIVLREKFRKISAPAGLKEQIISEQAASEKRISSPPKKLVASLAVIVLIFIALAIFIFPKHPSDDTLDVFQNQMAGIALRGYAMDLVTNNSAQIRAYLAQNHAPSNFILPSGLKSITPIGCAVENWQDTKVSMICFHTGKTLPPGESSDLWLFVIDRSVVKNAPTELIQKLSKVNRLNTATWIQNGELYFFGTTSDAQTLRQYL